MHVKLKVLLGIAALGIAVIAGYSLWFWWATDVERQFGTPDAWLEHVSDTNRLSFRYPKELAIIVPEDEVRNPVSLVKQGERGESVLIQFGTWFTGGEEFQALEEVVSRYERSAKRRTTQERHERRIGGREAVVLLQDEDNGRRIVEAFLWDEEGDFGPAARELSLQLPASASARDRRIYEELFFVMLDTIVVPSRVEEGIGGRPAAIPDTWREVTNAWGAFSFWYPPGWRIDAEQGTTTAQTVHDSGVSLRVRALPADAEVSMDELRDAHVTPFLSRTLSGSLREDRFGFPGVGTGFSLEGLLPPRDAATYGAFEPSEHGTTPVTTYLLALIATDVDEKGEAVHPHPRGRAYVISATLPDGPHHDTYVDQVRRMMRSFRLIAEQ